MTLEIMVLIVVLGFVLGFSDRIYAWLKKKMQ